MCRVNEYREARRVIRASPLYGHFAVVLADHFADPGKMGFDFMGDREMTEGIQKRLRIIQFALGRDQYGDLPRYCMGDNRNHYAVSPGCEDYDLCMAMVVEMLMIDCGVHPIYDNMHTFVVTQIGRNFMATHGSKPQKKR